MSVNYFIMYLAIQLLFNLLSALGGLLYLYQFYSQTEQKIRFLNQIRHIDHNRKYTHSSPMEPMFLCAYVVIKPQI